jgi:hypothetical protein
MYYAGLTILHLWDFVTDGGLSISSSATAPLGTPGEKTEAA